jgi:hypothetical protein
MPGFTASFLVHFSSQLIHNYKNSLLCSALLYFVSSHVPPPVGNEHTQCTDSPVLARLNERCLAGSKLHELAKIAFLNDNARISWLPEIYLDAMVYTKLYATLSIPPNDERGP